MKIYTQKNNKKKVILAVLIILALSLAAVVAYAYFNKQLFFKDASDSSKIDTGPTTKEQEEAGQKIKEENANKDSTNKPTNSDQPAEPTAQDGDKSTVGVSITAANQNGGSLQVRSLIETLSSDGVCTLTFSRSGYASITKSAAVQPLANSSTCQGFDIATSELSTGKWNMTLTFESSTLKGEASRMVEIL